MTAWGSTPASSAFRYRTLRFAETGHWPSDRVADYYNSHEIAAVLRRSLDFDTRPLASSESACSSVPTRPQPKWLRKRRKRFARFSA